MKRVPSLCAPVSAVLLLALVATTLVRPGSASTVFMKKHIATSSRHLKSNTPTSTPQPAAWIALNRGKNVIGVRTRSKAVAITIDDGPNGATAKVVDILDRYQAKGTFFFIGSRVHEPAEIRYAADHGHEIANHTYRHIPLAGRSGSEMIGEIQRNADLLAREGGKQPLWVRAWGGACGGLGASAVKATRMLYANWTVDSNDSHQSYIPPGRVFSNVVGGVSPGAIILIHQTHPESIAALPSILGWLKSHGYRCVTLSELAAEGQPIDGGFTLRRRRQ